MKSNRILLLGQKHIQQVMVLFFVLSILIAGCGKSAPAYTYTSMDGKAAGSISPADVIDQMGLGIGNGLHVETLNITIGLEQFKCKEGSIKTDFQAGRLVSVTSSVKDPLFLVDSFYSPEALVAKTDLAREYYRKFKMEPGTVLQIMDGPYCHAGSLWWYAITRDKTAADRNSFLVGLIPEGENGVMYLEPFEAGDQ